MIGTLFLLDAYDCQNMPKDLQELTAWALEAIESSGMKVMDMTAMGFPKSTWGKNHGDSVVTLIVPLTESHMACHTWPARRFVAVDLFTCGEFEPAYDAMRAMEKKLRPKRGGIQCHYRGAYLDRGGEA